MPDASLFAQMKDHQIQADEFDHPAHVRTAWECLDAATPDPAGEYARALWGLICRADAQAKYHATLTGAFLTLIGHEHVPGETWTAFAARNRDLLTRPKTLIQRHYSTDRLALNAARQWFLSADRAPLPPCPFTLHGVELIQLKPPG